MLAKQILRQRLEPVPATQRVLSKRFLKPLFRKIFERLYGPNFGNVVIRFLAKHYYG